MTDENGDLNGDDNPAPAPDNAQKKSDNILATITALLAIVGFLFAQFFFGIIALGIAAALRAGEEGADIMASLEDPTVVALPTIWSVLIANMAMFGILWLYLKRGDRLERLGWNRWSAKSWRNSLLVGIGCIAAAISFNYVYTEYIVPDLEMQALMREMIDSIPKTVVNQILLFTTIAIAAPVVEEIIFRGMLQNAFAGWMPAWLAVLMSAFVFALIHFQPEALPALMALGAAFGAIYHYTKSLRLTILLHVVNNAAALMLTPPPT